MKINYLIITLAVLISGNGHGQVPAGYYDGTDGLSGEALRSALYGIIHEHNELTYTSLWTHFQSTDKKTDGSVWDMYSDIPGGNPAYIYNFVVDQCGNYGSEGDCYNREHSFPKSWFNDAAPMVTDLFHIYPTDGYVNGQRSNYPYGEVGSASWTSTNGSKLGSCSFSGYSGIVFEPIDEYKGDFARSYFYMLTCYLDQVSSWSCPMLAGNDLAAWARDMLVQWSYEDPVSTKETGRNNAVYDIQENRNPYIDYPEWVGSVWGIPSDVSENMQPEVKIWFSDGQVHLRQKENQAGVLIISDLTGKEIMKYQIIHTDEDLSARLVPGIYIFSAVLSGRTQIEKVMITGQ